jgi:molybdenum cofactor synthesis domain-containing protein
MSSRDASAGSPDDSTPGAPLPLRVAVLTISDACAAGDRVDESGRVIREWVQARKYTLAKQAVIPDGTAGITRVLLEWSGDGAPDVILTTGGTGLGPRDVTPEATSAVLDRETPGLAERLRMEGQRHTPFAALSRGVAGIRGRTLIVNLPGSPRGTSEGLDSLGNLLPHAVSVLRGDDGGRHPVGPEGSDPPNGLDGSGEGA